MLLIRGMSDDIIEANIRPVSRCEVCGQEVEIPSQVVVGPELQEHEFGCYGENMVFTIGEDDAGVVVEMFYAGVWGAKIHQLGEDIPIPWPVSVGSKGGYTVDVRVDCSEGTKVRWMKRKA